MDTVETVESVKRVRLQHIHVFLDDIPYGVLHAAHPHFLLHAGQVHVPVTERNDVAPAARGNRPVGWVPVGREVFVVIEIEQEHVVGMRPHMLVKFAPFHGHLRNAEKRTVVVDAALARQREY